MGFDWIHQRVAGFASVEADARSIMASQTRRKPLALWAAIDNGRPSNASFGSFRNNRACDEPSVLIAKRIAAPSRAAASRDSRVESWAGRKKRRTGFGGIVLSSALSITAVTSAARPPVFQEARRVRCKPLQVRHQRGTRRRRSKQCNDFGGLRKSCGGPCAASGSAVVSQLSELAFRIRTINSIWGPRQTGTS